MQDYPWYSLAQNETLEQGDIFLSFPIYLPDALPMEKAEGEPFEVSGQVEYHSVVVLTQSCDLGRGKVSTVIVCPALPFDESLDVEGLKYSKGLFDEIRKGRRPPYHLLNPCNIAEQRFPHLIVNFGQVMITRYDQLEQYAQDTKDRIRLNPPYREHLAQAFARFVMRVGLPQDIESLPSN